jgi:hypothetical protein
MEFNQRVLNLIERKQLITKQVNSQLQRLKLLGQHQQSHADLFDLPLLPAVVDGQEE